MGEKDEENEELEESHGTDDDSDWGWGASLTYSVTRKFLLLRILI